MRVRCMINDLSSIKDAKVVARLQRAIHIDGPLTDLMIGKEYTVRAMKQSDEGLWLFLHTVPQSDFPYPYPIEFFQIMDSSLPASWWLECDKLKGGSAFKHLSFKEWARDDQFYERLVDGDEEAVRIYRNHLNDHAER